MTGQDLPRIKTPVPGPHSRRLIERLKKVECPNITFVGGAFPVFWKSACGANVGDEDGNVFIDFGSAFGVQGIGHTHPRITKAIQLQSEILLHGMGDVHPTELKVRLAEKLKAVTPGDLSQVIFSSSGSEAVESAMKTAAIHTKKSGLIAFEGAYHGLTFGALAATYREDFKNQFIEQIGKFVTHIPFPDPYHRSLKSRLGYDEVLDGVTARIKDHRKDPIGAVLVEPIQGRGGIIVPPEGFLLALRELCDRNEILLIFDEIMTGFGRTGRWFACDYENVTPDLIVLGKGMTGGFPISACVGSEEVMSGWGPSHGEAIHTSTFLGSPLGAASALETIAVLEDEKLVERSAQAGQKLIEQLKILSKKHTLIGDVRGRGLFVGVELVIANDPYKPAEKETSRLVDLLLQDGIIVLPCGPSHNILSITPPFVVTDEQINYFLERLDKKLDQIEKEALPQRVSRGAAKRVHSFPHTAGASA